jgi:alanyl-tRNA synthetase
VSRTGDIGTFKIVQETALAAGHRRIFAVTGPKAIALFQETFETVKNISQLFKVKHEQTLEVVEKLHNQHKELQKELKLAQQQLVMTQVPALLKTIETVNGVPFLYHIFNDVQADTLKDAITNAVTQQPGFYFFGSNLDDKVIFIATVSDSISNHVNLKEFGSWLKEQAQLQGGGSKTIIQGGGAKFDAKLKDSIKEWVNR